MPSLRMLNRLAVFIVLPLALPLTALAATNVSAADAERRLIVNYHRTDGTYDRWQLWAWPQGGEGRAFEFARETDFGRRAVVPISDASVRQFGIIPRFGAWDSRDGYSDRFVRLAPTGDTEVWLVSGRDRVYTDRSDVDLAVRIKRAFLDDPRRITLASTGLLTDAQRSNIRVQRHDGARTYAVESIARSENPAGGALIHHVHLQQPVAAADVGALKITVPEMQPQWVFARDVLTGPDFTALDVELGSIYTRSGTIFRVWSPVASEISLLLNELDQPDADPRVVAMKPVGRGVWEARVEGDLHGTAYRWRFMSYGKERIAPDVYCRAATLDTHFSVVIDMSRTNPPGWRSNTAPKLAHKTDEVIYEIHVRDYSVRDSVCPPEHRGTYLGLIHEGKASARGAHSGLTHLKELGVTAVHLLPIHDFPSPPDEYNWGYWTTFFNVPESNYTTNPSDPLGAARELKTAIEALHAADIRVILDVVYNHTSSSFEYSPFFQAVPYYYFRTTPDGRLRNDAGVGNSIADERPMVRRYILDSLRYWVEEYNVDGFRFDLVGTHHPDTVAAFVAMLTDLRSDLTLYGEPWTGGGPIQFGKGAQRGMNFAVFNDHVRNAIRGDLDGDGIGIATGPGGDAQTLMAGVAGAIDDFTNEPTESITYVSAHDNLTLWDKLVKVNPSASDAQLRAMQKFALGIVLTSQGVSFLHGGSDFGRTKGGNHNSYNASDDVNLMDWERKAEYRDIFEYVAGLIELRRKHPAFRMHDDALIREHLQVHAHTPLTAFSLVNSANGDDWSRILVIYNPEPHEQHWPLPDGTWTQVVDAERAGVQPLGQRTGRITLPAYSLAVLWR